MNWKGWISTTRKLYGRRRDQILLGVLISAVLISVFGRHTQNENPSLKESPEPDTMIPAGFVLVPIELENQQSLDSVMGPHAIVNLYKGTPLSGQPGRLVGRHMRLLRAPLNPQQFAVLVPENEVPQFVAPGAQFYAVLQNRSIQNGSDVPTASSPRRKTEIEYFQGE